MSTWFPVQPSSRALQQAYVNAQVNEINRGSDNLKNDTIQAFLHDPTFGLRLKGYSSSKKRTFAEDAYDRLTRALQSRIRKESIFENRVFFIRNLSFVTATQARRIAYEEALRFEGIDEETYLNLGFELFFIEPAPLMERLSKIKAAIQ